MILIRGIGSQGVSVEEIRGKMESVTLNAVREVLPDRVIWQACRDAGHVFRRRLLTPVVTVLHMLLAAFWPENSFASSWEVMWANTVGHLPWAAGRPVGSGTVSKARKRLGLKVWRGLFEWLSLEGQRVSEGLDGWSGHRVVLVDATCVSMPDTPDLKEGFGVNTVYRGKGRYPLARLVTLALANTMVVVDWALGAYKSSETALAAGILKSLRRGDLLIGDRCFAGAHYYQYYKGLGLEFLTRAHQNLKIDRIERLLEYGAEDFVGRLKVNKKRLADGQEGFIDVRFMRATLIIRGRRKQAWFVTSLVDAGKYPAGEIVSLYARRWRIETLFKAVKLPMGADVLRSMTAEGVHKEVAARLTALNMVRVIMVEAALEAGEDPSGLSFSHAVRAIVSFSPLLGSQPEWKLGLIYYSMLVEIASHVVKQRPGRNEPRMTRRDRQHYPMLKTTRQLWRLTNAA